MTGFEPLMDGAQAQAVRVDGIGIMHVSYTSVGRSIRIMAAKMVIPPTNVSRLRLEYSYTLGTQAFNPNSQYWAYFEAANISTGQQITAKSHTRAQAAALQGTNKVYDFTVNGVVDTIVFQFITSWDSTASGNYSGSIAVTRACAKGQGVNPFGTNVPCSF